MLDRLAACAHGVRILVEPFLHGLDDLLVLPPRDATLSSRRALSFDWAGMARIGPITAKFLAVLLSRKTVREFLTRRAHIYVLLRLIDKILLAVPARRLRAGCHRFRQRHGDAALVARFDRLAVDEVAAVGDGLELVDAERLLRCCRRARKLRPIRAHIPHLMVDNQMVLGIDRYLHIVANDARAAPARFLGDK